MKNPEVQKEFKKAVQIVESWGFKPFDFDGSEMTYTTAKSHTTFGSSGYIYLTKGGTEYKLRVSDHGLGLNRARYEYQSLSDLHLALFPDQYEMKVNRIYEEVEIECSGTELSKYQDRSLKILGERLSAKGNKVFRITFQRYTDKIEYVKK